MGNAAGEQSTKRKFLEGGASPCKLRKHFMNIFVKFGKFYLTRKIHNALARKWLANGMVSAKSVSLFTGITKIIFPTACNP